jgi:hypothetical protein
LLFPTSRLGLLQALLLLLSAVQLQHQLLMVV